jgi:hypothetical protein
MSGRHFDYKKFYLTYIAEQLEQNIEFIDIHDERCLAGIRPFCFWRQLGKVVARAI